MSLGRLKEFQTMVPTTFSGVPLISHLATSASWRLDGITSSVKTPTLNFCDWPNQSLSHHLVLCCLTRSCYVTQAGLEIDI